MADLRRWLEADVGGVMDETAWRLRRVLPGQWKARLRRIGQEARLAQREALYAARIGRADSFGSRIDGLQGWLFTNLDEAVASYHWDVFAKASQKRLAQRMGFDVPNTYRDGARLDEVFVAAEALDAFVIKPNSSHNGIAFRGLLRDGRYLRNVLSGTLRRPVVVREALRREYAPLRRPDEWVLEELLRPPDGSARPVTDHKFYCFAGRAELIYERSFVGGRERYLRQFFTRDWVPVNVGLNDHEVSVLTRPAEADALLAAAEAAAGALAYPFLRVDLYSTSRGVVFGEFTPGIGRSHLFNDEWNARLVARWDEAASAVLERVRSGALRPLTAAGEVPA